MSHQIIMFSYHIVDLSSKMQLSGHLEHYKCDVLPFKTWK